MVRTRSALAALLCGLTAAAAGAQEPRTFALRFQNANGQFVPFYQEMSTVVDQRIKVQGQDLPQSQKSTFYYAWTPIKGGTDPAARWTLRQKIEGLKMAIDISGNPIKYDSTKPDEAATGTNPGLIDYFKGLNGTEFVVTLTKDYRVAKVDGKDAFIAKLSAGSAQMDALLKKVMTDDALKEMADPTYALLPDAPKKKGDRWERKKSLNLGPIGTYDLTYKFTFAEPDKEGARKDMDRIEVESVLVYAAPKEPAEGLVFRIKEGSKLTSDPAGSKGTVYYDPKRQRIDFAEINIKLKGDLLVTIGGSDTRVELTQVQRTTVRTRGVSFLAPPGTPEPSDVPDPPAAAGGPAPGPACVPCPDPGHARRLFPRFHLRPCFPGWRR